MPYPVAAVRGRSSVQGSGAASVWYLPTGVAAANCIAAYQPKGAASLAASYSNLANPGTYDAAPGTAPTFNAATGWTFNGSTQYLDTGVSLANANYSMFFRVSDWTTGGNQEIGGYYHDNPSSFLIQSDGANLKYYNGAFATNTHRTSGVIGIAGLKCYYNGTAEANDIGAGATHADPRTLYIGALNYASGVIDFANIKIQAVALYDVVLTADQVAELSTSMAAL